MKNSLLEIAFAAIALLVLASAAILLKLRKQKKPSGDITKRGMLTANEQAMYHRLIQCLPGPQYVVLAQVCFAALLDTKDIAVRNTFSRKMTDFVVLDKSFEVLAIVELNDASHKRKKAEDAQRDAMLTEAGYRVIRYSKIPDRDKVLADFRKEMTGGATSPQYGKHPGP